MKFNKEEIIKILEDLNLKENIELSDIPNLHLYMDQVIQLFENNLSHYKRYKDDKLLTKTMINNYTKDKLLMPVKNKKYTRNHIILMILIYNLKQSLSMADIKILLNGLISEINHTEDESVNLDSIYSLFLELKNNETVYELEYLNNLLDSIDKTTKEEDYSQYEQLLLTILCLINSANVQKRIAEHLIDTYFSNQ